MVKSMDAFKEHLCSEEKQDANECPDSYEDKALQYATFSFFGGIIITYALDLFVHSLMHHLPSPQGKPATAGNCGEATKKDGEVSITPDYDMSMEYGCTLALKCLT